MSVIRLSGEETCGILQTLCARNVFPPHEQRLTRLFDTAGTLVDDVMVAFHPGPASYTGEDLAEISCHGNPLIVDAICRAIRATGRARLAERGEFTRRAYVSGKLDLAQAEAVQACIAARGTSGLDMARSLLDGQLSAEITAITARLKQLLADLEASFITEDAEYDELALDRELADLTRQTDALLKDSALAPTLMEGIHTVIAGRPNAGKSSLFNAILGSERAIVHEEAGTTRDVLREHLRLGALDFVFYDTAGIHETASGPEGLGIRRSMEALEQCDLALYVVDASTPLLPEEQDWLTKAPRTIVVFNKRDLCPEATDLPGHTTVRVSALTGEGLTDLTRAMEETFPSATPRVFLERHRVLLNRSRKALQRAREGLMNGMPADICSMDLQEATASMDAVMGQGLTDDILDMVFATFCVGK